MMKLSFLIVLGIFAPYVLLAQLEPDKVFSNTIKTIKLFPQNNQMAIPVITLNSSEQLELHFDDLVNNPRNYFYTYQLCNADWSEAQWSPFDYIKGFQQNRIGQYRVSAISQIPYVHYQAILPEYNAVPSRSGNYILKVYADGDVSNVVFTKRFYVVDRQANIGARVVQPYDFELARSHQKVDLVVSIPQINMINPQQFKTVILQNGRWDDAIENIQPTMIKGGTMEYNTEQNCIFPAGKEYRWADLQSFRFQSDRVESVDRTQLPIHIYIKPDRVRSGLQYIYYRDANGYNQIMSSEGVNPWWQTDYAAVKFNFSTNNGQPLVGKNVYMVGELTGNQIGDTSLMKFDASIGRYTKTLLLKQGYYSYAYVTREKQDKFAKSDPSFTEGNYWETDNEYTVLVYYRPYSGRHDELIGLTTINSFFGSR
jgi:hypothetical protein